MKRIDYDAPTWPVDIDEYPPPEPWEERGLKFIDFVVVPLLAILLVLVMFVAVPLTAWDWLRN